MVHINDIKRFVETELELKENDDRHTDGYRSGFVSACRIILNYMDEDANCVEDES